MDTYEFEQLAERAVADPTLIPGIYNYCDSRCARCEFKHRCLNYQDRGGFESGANTVAAAEILGSDVHGQVDGLDVLTEWPDDERGEARDAEADAALLAESEAVRTLTERDTLVIHAAEYSQLAETLTRALHDAALAAEDQTLLDALDKIRWNAGLIRSKTYRAVSSDYSRYESASDLQRDANGSAKVARLLIAGSRAGWTVLVTSRKVASNGIPARMIEILDSIDEALHVRFPHAMRFIRPGFDEQSDRPWSLFRPPV